MLEIDDVSRAFFEAPAVRDVCVELPEEALTDDERGHDLVGHLKMSLYGTRDAAMNWQEDVATRVARAVHGMKAKKHDEGYQAPEKVEFVDFERECFGAGEEGCDAWFYGEDPTREKKVRAQKSVVSKRAREQAWTRP